MGHGHAVGLQVNATITDLVVLACEARVDEAARRILKEQFLLGLFENLVDPATRQIRR